ncbi:hypothetical protein M2R47_09245, partial [Moraxella sp. Tifton1]|nr:hypothetical protein [Moraxella sp. Tifton1]
KTSTTHSAITDQAGLSHINTENFNQPEVQDELNQIIANDFDKEQALKELNAQTVITTEFGREAPKVVADFSKDQIKRIASDPNLTPEEKTTEQQKWAEGGIYRVALHTAMGLLATGTIEGAASAGTTAYTIPKIDEYLTNQGFDETTRQTTLLALSATLGVSIGDSTASTVNNVGQVQWNYLSHRENANLAKLKLERSKLMDKYPNGGCLLTAECATQLEAYNKEIDKLERLSWQRDRIFDKAYADCRSGKDCNQFYYLHVTQRNEWNKEGVELFKKQFNPKLSYEQQSVDFQKNWDKYEDYKNAFHNFSIDGKTILKNPDGTYPHAKYVHKEGQFEVIVDKKTGQIVTTPSNAGTFNYYKDLVGHMDYDVDPWTDFGSGNGDNTKYNLRRSGSGILFGEFGIWDDKDKAIEKFKKIDEEKKK